MSVDWDRNPRFQGVLEDVIINNTPGEVKKAFQAAKDYVDAHPEQVPLIIGNSWNEWMESMIMLILKTTVIRLVKCWWSVYFWHRLF